MDYFVFIVVIAHIAECFGLKRWFDRCLVLTSMVLALAFYFASRVAVQREFLTATIASLFLIGVLIVQLVVLVAIDWFHSKRQRQTS